VSQTFANSAAKADVSYDNAGGATLRTAGAETLTIRYDDVTQSYILGVPGRSQTFALANRTADGTYHKVSSEIVDDLTLTPTGPSAGATFRYVGAGFWQRQRQTTAGGTDGSFDAFVYGIPTVNVTRSGRGYYTLQLIGAAALPNGVAALTGDAKLNAALDTGVLKFDGNVSFRDSVSGRVVNGGPITGLMQLASASNELTGSIRLNVSNAYAGTLDGKLFGPNAEEIGASFSATNVLGDVAVGTLLGRTDPTSVIVPLDQLTTTRTFGTKYYGRDFTRVFTYDPSTSTYTFSALSASSLSNAPNSYGASYSQFALGAGQKSVVQGSPNFTTYEGSVDGRAVKASFYNTGAANGEVQLSYASFYKLELATSGGGSDVRYELFGLPTPSNFLPSSGTATYKGLVYGDGELPYSSKHVFDVSGQSTFVVDFATLNGNGTLDLMLKSVSDGSITALSRNVSLNNAFISDSSNMVSTGYFTWGFYGPRGEELGAAFGFSEQMTYQGGIYYIDISGVTVAKRQ
jgi:hypothetical protein